MSGAAWAAELPDAPGAEGGNVALPVRERQVLRLLAAGCSVRQIAAALGISRSSVRTYVAGLDARFGVRSAAALVAAAVRAGILPVVVGRGRPVDPWERRLIALLGDGMTEKEIARAVGKSRNVVHERLEKLRGRLGAANQAALIYRAAEAGAFPEAPLGGGA